MGIIRSIAMAIAAILMTAATASAEQVSDQSAQLSDHECLSRSYMIFFDWNSTEVSADAKAVLGDLVDFIKMADITKIEIIGYTDSSGPTGFNLALSRRRAEAVGSVLFELGVGGVDIVITAKGESSLLVPTPDGVREPQNRRVDTVFP